MSAHGGTPGPARIPAMTAAAAERPATAWRSSTATSGSPTPSCSTEARRSAPRWSPRASSPATGWPSGRPTAPSGSSPCSASSRPGRARAGQHPLQGRRGGRHPRAQRAKVLVTVTDFLGTDYLAMLEGPAPSCPTSRRSSCSGPSPGGRRRGTTSWPRATDEGAGRGRAAARRPSARTTPPTSSSRPAPPACPRAWCRPTAAPAGWPPTGWR